MKRIKKIISIIMILTVIVIPTVYAAGETNFSVILSSDKQEVEKGEEVEITVDLEVFPGVGVGVNSFMADLEYDKTKISIKEVQSGTEIKKEITGLNDWDKPDYYNDKVVTSKGSFVTATESIMNITFVVNENAAVGTTTITVKNAEAANEDNDFVGETGTINITLKEKTPAQQECEHTYGEYIDNQNGTHSRECAKCEDKQTENCEYEVEGNKKVCTKCGAEVEVTEEHTHNYKEFKDNGDGTHSSKCEGCEEVLKEQHTYKDGKCTKCNAVEPKDDPKPPADDGKGEGKEYPNAGITTTLLVAITIIAVMAIVLYRKNQTYKGI